MKRIMVDDSAIKRIMSKGLGSHRRLNNVHIKSHPLLDFFIKPGNLFFVGFIGGVFAYKIFRKDFNRG